MSRKDISFVRDGEGYYEMPLVFNGTTEGSSTLAQRIAILFIAELSNPTRNYGTSFVTLMRGANTNEAHINNIIDQSLAQVKELFNEEQEDIFIDEMHLNEKGKSILTDSIAQAIVNEIRKNKVR